MTPANSRQNVIPVAGWILAAVALPLLSFVIAVSTRHHSIEARLFFPIFVGVAVAGNILAIGYVYGDAKRRGMRYVMWTLLATFLFWGIGIILYFILREPLMGFCSKCGSPASGAFAFCPHCGAGLRPSCPACHRPIEGPWSHCAWCGTPVGQPVNAPLTRAGAPPVDRPA
jgi:hypothetical protein